MRDLHAAESLFLESLRPTQGFVCFPRASADGRRPGSQSTQDDDGDAGREEDEDGAEDEDEAEDEERKTTS